MERSTKRDLRNWRSFFRFVQTKNLFRALSSLLLKMENFRKRVEFFPSVVTNRNSIIEEGSFISFLFVIHSIAIKNGNNQETLRS